MNNGFFSKNGFLKIPYFCYFSRHYIPKIFEAINYRSLNFLAYSKETNTVNYSFSVTLWPLKHAKFIIKSVKREVLYCSHFQKFVRAYKPYIEAWIALANFWNIWTCYYRNMLSKAESEAEWWGRTNLGSEFFNKIWIFAQFFSGLWLFFFREAHSFLDFPSNISFCKFIRSHIFKELTRL